MLSNGIVAGDRRASLGWLLIRAGRPDFAVATCGNDEGASINDLSCSHEAFAALGRYADAKEAALRLMQRVPATPAAIEQVRAKEPRQAYQTFLTWRAHNFLPANASWFQKAQVLADAGDTQSALKALQQSIARREPTAVKIRSTPGFAAMRGNPSFDQLSKAVGA
jgi:tetratricopeptide (TPR) repeat protein